MGPSGGGVELPLEVIERVLRVFSDFPVGASGVSATERGLGICLCLWLLIGEMYAG